MPLLTRSVSSALAALILLVVTPVSTTAQDIIPPHKDAIGGGNPLQGLGRPDDPEPSRVEEYLESLKSADTNPEASPPQTDSTASDTTDKEQGSASGKIQEGKDAALDSNTESATEGSKKATEVETSEEKNENSGNSKTVETTEPEKKDNERSPLVAPPINLTPPQQLDSNTPHRKALALIQNKSYGEARSLLEKEKRDYPGDTRLRYLLAVVYVLTNEVESAKTEYRFVIEKTADQKLKELAKMGLKKLK